MRNLGLDSNANINEIPDDYVTKTSNDDGSYTFECTHLNEAALRDYTSVDLPYSDQFSSTNRLYKRFEVNSNESSFSSVGFADFQKSIDDYGSSGSGYCPEGYRIPNQMELSMMMYYQVPLGANQYSRTYWSFGPYTGQFGPTGKSGNANNIGFAFTSSNMTVDNGTYGVPNTSKARCVRDIRVE